MRLSPRWIVPAVVALCFSASAASAQDTIELDNGDVLKGEIVQSDDEVVIIEHDMLGRLEIPRDQIKTYTIQGADGPIVEPPPPPKTEIDYWDLAVDLSLNATTGNTEEQQLRIGLNASRRTDRTRLALDFSYYWKATDSITTDNKATFGVRNDWLIPESKWFRFVAGRVDYDQFESWDERVNAQGGPGYHFIDSENLELDGYGGLGVRKEFGSANDQAQLEGVLGTDLTWTATGRQTVAFSLAYFPVVTEINDFRLRSTAQWRYALDTEYALSLVIGYLLEYQNVVDPGKERTDFRLWVGVQYGF